MSREPGSGRLEADEIGRLREVATVLVLNTHGIGDVLMTTPALTALDRHLEGRDQLEVLMRSSLEAGVLRRSFPDSRVTCLSDLAVGGLLRWTHRLRRRGPLVTISTYNVDARKAWLLGKLVGAEWSIGFTRGTEKPFTVTLASTGRHKIEENYRLLSALGIPFAHQSYSWKPTEQEMQAARALAPDERTLVLTPGSNPDETFKRWPEENYSRLIEVLTQTKRFQTLIVGGSTDRPAASRIVEHVRSSVPGHRIRNFAGQLDLETSAALLARSHVVLGGDCGLTHIAAAAGSLTVVLAGPTRSHVTGPRGENVTILESNHYCTACYERELRIDPACTHPACMESHGIAEVVSAIGRLL